MNTIKEQIHLKGIGLHSGISSTLSLYPSNQNFISINNIPANIIFTKETAFYTQVGNTKTIEHLLAFLYANNIDSVRIENTGPEIPIFDGSCQEYISNIIPHKYSNDTNIYELPFSFHSKYKHSECFIIPNDKLYVTIYHDDVEISTDLSDFNTHIGISRTFTDEESIESLRNMGLIKGGSIDNALIFKDGLPTSPVRLENEHVYHKLLDMIGDISLLGMRVKGEIVIFNPSHDTTRYFVKKIYEKLVD